MTNNQHQVADITLITGGATILIHQDSHTIFVTQSDLPNLIKTLQQMEKDQKR